MKRCYKCGETKGPEEFSKNRAKADGLQNCCKPCDRQRGRRYYAANRAAKRHYHEANRERHMLNGARARAEKAGVPFAITVDDIVIPERCPVLGLRLEVGGTSRDNSPSLDRLVPSLGYSKGNVRVISWRANTIKTNATPEELIAVGRWAESEINKREV